MGHIVTKHAVRSVKTRNCTRDDGTCLSCLAGFYGEMCDKECTGHCSGNQCDQLANATICSGGCEAGFYGQSCDQNCSSNCVNNNCEKNGGKCTACPAGKQGDMCDTGEGFICFICLFFYIDNNM